MHLIPPWVHWQENKDFKHSEKGKFYYILKRGRGGREWVRYRMYLLFQGLLLDC